jgi:arsenite oxidase small subunit
MAADIDPSRRRFLGNSIGAGAAAVIAVHPGDAEAARQIDYPRTYPVIPIGTIGQLEKSVAKNFNYPDEHSPCMLVKLDSEIAGGVGPDKNIVAYSSMCTHMGCIVSYDSSSQTFQCPCHFSVFDPGSNGQMVCGHATENLARIDLGHDPKTGRIVATGVQGRIYGRVSNLL